MKIRHNVTFTDASRIGFEFDIATETFGEALRRLGYTQESVERIEVLDAPISYEPDHSLGR